MSQKKSKFTIFTQRFSLINNSPHFNAQITSDQLEVGQRRIEEEKNRRREETERKKIDFDCLLCVV